MSGKVIVIFVEGQTDEVFYKKICQHLKKNKKPKSKKLFIKNLKGIGNFEKKACAKIKNEISPKFPKSDLIIFCAYDTDVFSIPFQQKPPVNWKNLEKKLLCQGVSKIFHIKAKKMIEDWFLIDAEGICKSLKIKSQKPSGKNGYEKIKNLFKKANKVYQKGYNINQFVDNLDYDKILSNIKEEISELNKQL